MMIHEVTEKVGRYKSRKRVGRGHGSGHGKTAGRGHKGARSRSGWTNRAYFEGGQMPFTRRIPKRGFSNKMFRTDYNIVNVKDLEANFESGADVDTERLLNAGLVHNPDLPLKILGDGELSKSLNVTAEKFSGSARSKIEAAGGSVNEVRKKPWRRQPGPGKKRRLREKKKEEAAAKGE